METLMDSGAYDTFTNDEGKVGIVLGRYSRTT